MKRFTNLKKQISFLLAVLMIAMLMIPATLSATAANANEVVVIKGDGSGQQEYATFRELFGDDNIKLADKGIIQDGDTIKLLKDITMPNKQTYIDIPNVTIDGNGFTIYPCPTDQLALSGNRDSGIEPYLRVNNVTGTEIKNVTFDFRSGHPGHQIIGFCATATDTFTMDNVTIYGLNAASLRLDRGVATLNNCTVYNTGIAGPSIWMNKTDGALDLTINGGYYGYYSNATGSQYALIDDISDLGTGNAGNADDTVYINNATLEVGDIPFSAISGSVSIYGCILVSECDYLFEKGAVEIEASTHIISTRNDALLIAEEMGDDVTLIEDEEIFFSALVKGGIVTDDNAAGTFEYNGVTYFSTIADAEVMLNCAKPGAAPEDLFEPFYGSFAEAVEYIEAGSILTFLTDATAPAASFVINKANVTINGNGKTLYPVANSYIENYMTIKSDGVVINDLIFNCSSTMGATGAHGDLQPINFEPGNTTSVLTMNNVTVYAQGNNAIRTRGGILTMNDCTVYLVNNNWFNLNGSTAKVVNVNGGRLYASASCGDYRPMISGGSAGDVINIVGATVQMDGAADIDQANATINLYGATVISKAAKIFNGANINLYGTQVISAKDGAVLGTTGALSDVSYAALAIGGLDGLVTEGAASYTGLDGNTYYTTKANTIDIMDGASVRLVENSNGIRFTSAIAKADVAAIDEINDADTAISYGTVIVPTDYLAGVSAFTMAALDVAGKAYLNVEATSAGITEDDTNIYINAAMVNIKAANYSRDFSAVSYVKYIKNGQEVLVYATFDKEVNTRNIVEVATAAKADTTIAYTDDQIAALNAYLGITA